MKFDDKKLETSLYHMVKQYFDILNRLGVNHERDGETDTRTEWPVQ